MSLALYEKLLEDEPGDLTKLGFITLAYTAIGDTVQTKSGISKLEAALDTDSMSRAVSALMLCHAMSGNYEEAMQMVEKGVSFRLPMMVYLHAEPILKPLHSIPRYQELVRQVLGEQTSFDLPIRKYKKSLLGEELLEDYKMQLEQLMKKNKPYLNANLTLRDLANMLEVPANQMSQLLNEGFDKNFSEYVNSYRLETFKSKATDLTQHHLTILALAYDSGFNSKTVFNAFFKKMIGKTPKENWKEVVL